MDASGPSEPFATTDGHRYLTAEVMAVLDSSLRPEIAMSWRRSELSGLSPERVPTLDHLEGKPQGRLLDSAAPVLQALAADLEGTKIGLILADRDSRIVDVRVGKPCVREWMQSLGVAPGVRFGEDNMGTNSIGTPFEVRRGIAVRGDEHFTIAFKNCSCYGHPIVDPVTGHVEGVLDISSEQGDESPLFPALVRRVVRDIGDRLRDGSPRSHVRLASAFAAATRGRPRAVVAIGPSMVLASAAALDLLDPRDHAMLRAYAEEVRGGGSRALELTLTAGLRCRLRWQLVEDGGGVVLTLVPERGGGQLILTPDKPVGQWPLLLVGEMGTGRTTTARQRLGYPPEVVDVVDLHGLGQDAFAQRVDALFGAQPKTVLVENVQLLTEPLALLLIRALRSFPGRVVLTSTTTSDAESINRLLATACPDRVDLAPLRLRRHEIPRLAESMLAQIAAGGPVRLQPATLRVLAAQTWLGNLAELHRVIVGLARRRSAGDITPADLPASHRATGTVSTPREQAEHDVIVAALEAAHGNKVRAARALDVSRSTLYNRIHALRIEA